MKTPEEEFDLLAKRWEIACQQIRHESNMIQQRSTRLFSAKGFLLGAYALLGSRLFDKNTIAPGPVFLSILMLVIAVFGFFVTRALLNEIDAAADAANGIQTWWNSCLAKVKRHSDVDTWFPDLQFNSRLPVDPSNSLVSPPFRLMRKVDFGIWIGLATLAGVILIVSVYGHNAKPAPQEPTSNDEAHVKTKEEPMVDIAAPAMHETIARPNVPLQNVVPHATPRSPSQKEDRRAFFEYPSHFAGVIITTGLSMAAFRGIAKLVG